MGGCSTQAPVASESCAHDSVPEACYVGRRGVQPHHHFAAGARDGSATSPPTCARGCIASPFKRSHRSPGAPCERASLETQALAPCPRTWTRSFPALHLQAQNTKLQPTNAARSRWSLIVRARSDVSAARSTHFRGAGWPCRGGANGIGPTQRYVCQEAGTSVRADALPGFLEPGTARAGCFGVRFFLSHVAQRSRPP